MSTATVAAPPQTGTPPGNAPAPRTLRYRFRKIWRVVLFAALFPFFQNDLVASVIPGNPSPDIIRFVSGVITLIPLATFIEVVTEDLIERLGQLVGGLLHAFFGNIAFFAISISTLVVAFNNPEKRDELVGVVQSSIAGTIIIDLLFILGVAILVGGFRNGRMQFSAEYSNQYAEMITVAVIALALPSLGAIIGIGVGTGASKKLDSFEVSTISNVTAVVLIIAYIGYLGWTVFGFRDNAAKPQNPDEVSESLSGNLIGPLAASIAPIEEEQQREQLQREALSNAPTLRRGETAPVASVTAEPPAEGSHAHLSNADIINERIHQKIIQDRGETRTRAEQEELDRKRGIALWELAILILGTAGVVFISDNMAESLREVLQNGAAHSLGLSPFFIGFIIVPISSNIVELSAAASSAWHDRMETCLAVTAGSAIQVALLVAPALILVSHVLGLTSMNLVFGLFILAIFALIAYLFQIITVDGETTWLEGLQLTSFFAVIAGVAFFAGVS